MVKPLPISLEHDGDHWHIVMAEPLMVALAYICDDWGDATADAPADGDMSAEEIRLWMVAQQLASLIIAARWADKVDPDDLPDGHKRYRYHD